MHRILTSPENANSTDDAVKLALRLLTKADIYGTAFNAFDQPKEVSRLK